MSVKWVGLFTIAWVGSLTIVQLWVLIGDPKTVTPVSLCRYLLLTLWKMAKSWTEIVVQAFSRPSLLFDRHPGDFLRGTVRYPFSLPRQSRRR